MRRQHTLFVDRGVEVVVLGPDDANAFRAHWERQDLPFVGLPDPSRSVLDLYGQQIKLFKLGRLPAQVIIDAYGIVRWAHYGGSMTDIPRNAELLALLDTLDVPNKSQ